MRIIIFKWLVVSFLIVAFVSSLGAQVCQVDSQYQAPGIYPSNTLAPMDVGSSYDHLLQVVFPEDTVLFTQTFPYDSFVISQVTNIPAGLNWECNANHPQCHYRSQNSDFSRACFRIYGTPTNQNAAYPAYDSILVRFEYWITAGFSGPLPVVLTKPIYYRIASVLGLEDASESAAGIQVFQDPESGYLKIGFKLQSSGEAQIKVLDMFGRTISGLQTTALAAGYQEQQISTVSLAGGWYILQIQDGQTFQRLKFFKMN
jgi:hypothetical protein